MTDNRTPLSADAELYWRLLGIFKSLESSGVFAESTNKDAYKTVLDVLNFVRLRSIGSESSEVAIQRPSRPTTELFWKRKAESLEEQLHATKSSVPKGWKLVPISHTPKMLEAVEHYYVIEKVWASMIEAAPTYYPET